MAEVTTKTYINMAAMSVYDQLFKEYVGNINAANLKSIKVNKETGDVSFFVDESPAEDAVPLAKINIPSMVGSENSGNAIQKVENAIAGNVPVLTENGDISDSKVKLDDLARKEQVILDIASAIQNATHIQFAIVDAVPSVEEAETNIWYLVKDETATGEDKYKEYLKIGDEVVCTGSTSIDLTEYAKTVDVTQAITDATTPITEKVNTLETNVNNFVPVSEDDIRSLFTPTNEV